MSIKAVILKQYQGIVDRIAEIDVSISVPNEGWIRTTRKALSMSGAQLARRMGVSRSNIANIEKAELSGGVTLKTMQQMAEAMNCRFVYAIVPEGTAESLIDQRAAEKGRKIAEETAKHMALEAQNLSPDQLNFEAERLTRDIKNNMPSDLWDD